MSIIDPVTMKLFDLKSDKGFEILKNYLDNLINKKGGSSSSEMEVDVGSLKRTRDERDEEENPFDYGLIEDSIPGERRIIKKPRLISNKSAPAIMKNEITSITDSIPSNEDDDIIDGVLAAPAPSSAPEPSSAPAPSSTSETRIIVDEDTDEDMSDDSDDSDDILVPISKLEPEAKTDSVSSSMDVVSPPPNNILKERLETWNIVNTMEIAIIIDNINNPGSSISIEEFLNPDGIGGGALLGGGYNFDGYNIKAKSLLTLLDHWHDFEKGRSNFDANNLNNLKKYILDYINIINIIDDSTDDKDLVIGLINSLKYKIENSKNIITPKQPEVLLNLLSSQDGKNYNDLLGTNTYKDRNIENLSVWVLSRYAANNNHNFKVIYRRLEQDVAFKINYDESKDWKSNMNYFFKHITNGEDFERSIIKENPILNDKTMKIMNGMFTPPIPDYPKSIFFNDIINNKRNYLSKFLVSIDLYNYMKQKDTKNPYLIIDTNPKRMDNHVLRYLNIKNKDRIALEIFSYVSFIDSSNSRSIDYPISKKKTLKETTMGNWLTEQTDLLNTLKNETNLENFDDFIIFNKNFYEPGFKINSKTLNNIFRARSFINYVNPELTEKFNKIILDGFWFQLENPVGANSRYNLYYNKKLMSHLYNKEILDGPLVETLFEKENWINLTEGHNISTLVTVPFSQTMIHLLIFLRDQNRNDFEKDSNIVKDYKNHDYYRNIFKNIFDKNNSHEYLLNILADGSIFEKSKLIGFLFKDLKCCNKSYYQWINFIKIISKNIRDKIYIDLIKTDIGKKQYIQFYDGLIRKIRDEKKLGDHNQCYQANKHEIRLATIDRPLFAQSILTNTKSVLCRDTGGGLFIFEPNTKVSTAIRLQVDLNNKLKQDIDEINRLLIEEPKELIKKFIEDIILKNKESYDLKTIVKYESFYKNIDKLSSIESPLKNNVKQCLIILVISNYYNIDSSLDISLYFPGVNTKSDLNKVNLKSLKIINNIIINKDVSESDKNKIIDNIVDNVDDDIVEQNLNNLNNDRIDKELLRDVNTSKNNIKKLMKNLLEPEINKFKREFDKKFKEIKESNITVGSIIDYFRRKVNSLFTSGFAAKKYYRKFLNYLDIFRKEYEMTSSHDISLVFKKIKIIELIFKLRRNLFIQYKKEKYINDFNNYVIKTVYKNDNFSNLNEFLINQLCTKQRYIINWIIYYTKLIDNDFIFKPGEKIRYKRKSGISKKGTFIRVYSSDKVVIRLNDNQKKIIVLKKYIRKLYPEKLELVKKLFDNKDQRIFCNAAKKMSRIPGKGTSFPSITFEENDFS